MKNEIILEYWDIFLTHLCEYHPLEKDFIETYKYELDWQCISANRQIAWDDDFIEKYKGWLSWHTIAANEAITWTPERIEKYIKRLDWFYLSFNKNVPLTEAFIKKYQKDIFLSAKNQILADRSVKQYKLSVRKDADAPEGDGPFTGDLETFLSEMESSLNEYTLYTKVMVPLLKKKKPEAIFSEKFDYSQRYFYMAPRQQDEHGLTPEFKLVNEKIFDDDGWLTVTGKKTIELVNGSLQQGPARLNDMPRLSNYTHAPTYIVSEAIKQILSAFRLPEHVFVPVQLKPNKIHYQGQYYFFQVKHDSLYHSISYAGSSFSYVKEQLLRKSKQYPVPGPIKNYKDLIAAQQKLWKEDDPGGYYPYKAAVNQPFDVFAEGNDIIVNEFVKQKLEEKFAGSISFGSAQRLNIVMDKKAYQEGKKLAEKVVVTAAPIQTTTTATGKFYMDKKARLERAAALKIPDSKDEFAAMEMKLRVVFPDTFKTKYRKNSLSLEDYKLLPIKDFYLPADSFAARNAEAYKAVAVAENGLGDTLCLLLEKESDYLLGKNLYEFLHETGDIKKL